MKRAGIRGVVRRGWKTATTRRDAKAQPVPDLVNPGLLGPAAGSAVGRRHHVCAHLGGLAVPRRGAGCLEPPHRGLGDGPTPAGRAGRGRVPMACSSSADSGTPGGCGLAPASLRARPVIRGRRWWRCGAQARAHRRRGSGRGVPRPSADPSAAREAGGLRGALRPPCQAAVFNTAWAGYRWRESRQEIVQVLLGLHDLPFLPLVDVWFRRTELAGSPHSNGGDPGRIPSHVTSPSLTPHRWMLSISRDWAAWRGEPADLGHTGTIATPAVHR